MHPRSRVPRVGDLIDLEVALEEDRERPIEVLLARDARIGREIDAADLDDRSLVLAWLERVRPAPESPGRAVEALLQLSGWMLVAAGLLSGSLAVAGWLWSGARGVPVNVVQLWPALVGLQLVLAAGWVVVRLASGLLARSVGDGLSTWLPAACGALAVRFAPPGAREAWNRFRALDRVYGGLRFWCVTRLSQSFAVAFNVGALAALFFIPTVDDPAFGWRSRLLDAGEVQALTTVLAAPWAPVWAEAVPTAEQIAATAGSSLAVDRVTADDTRDPEVWAAWWPFLVASFVVYGLLPRLVLRGVAGLRTRGLLRGVAFDHQGCARLRERLRRHVVDGRGSGEEPVGARAADLEPPRAPLELPDRVHVVRWAGVPGSAEAVGQRLARAYGVMVDGAETAGGLDLAADRAALDSLRGAQAVLVVVEAWEAPSADYLDFLRKLRGALAERAPVVVLPCDVGVDGQPAEVEARHLSLWRRHLGALADPWLRVEPLPAADSGGAGT